MSDFSIHVATLLAVIDAVIVLGAVPWILATKKESTSAVAWVLVVLLVPLLGFLLFVVFGYTQVNRPLRRKRRHRVKFVARNPEAQSGAAAERFSEPHPLRSCHELAELAVRLGAFPVRQGNRLTLYRDTATAFEAFFAAIKAARHHVHLEFYIVQPDETGKRLVSLLAEKAKQGVEVRLLYDAVGSWTLPNRFLRPLHRAGGQSSAFLSINPLRRRVQFNLRNHRKITVIDGVLAFTGGVNIGDEYLGKSRRYGRWRDMQVWLDGPAAADLQRIFVEDWDFAQGENLYGGRYFPVLSGSGDTAMQIVASGPDQPINSIRELLFAAITTAQRRVWIATPYFAPDAGILDALRLAAWLGVDVRLLCPHRTDHFLADFAARYYWTDLMAAGVKIHEFDRGMMHSKMMIVDDCWAWVGSANLDNRSLKLNFESICVLQSSPAVERLEELFQRELNDSRRVDPKRFAKRRFGRRLLENTCRLMSPIL